MRVSVRRVFRALVGEPEARGHAPATPGFGALGGEHWGGVFPPLG